MLTGFSDDELSKLMAEKTEGLTDPDEIPNPPEIPVSCPGDVWSLGKHRLMCGDSTSVDDMEKLTAGQMVDMWLTDPPYNVAYEGGTTRLRVACPETVWEWTNHAPEECFRVVH